jgi:hypothetical protein
MRLREGSWPKKVKEMAVTVTRSTASTIFFLAAMVDDNGPREPGWAKAILQRRIYLSVNMSEVKASLGEA